MRWRILQIPRRGDRLRMDLAIGTLRMFLAGCRSMITLPALVFDDKPSARERMIR